MKGIICSDLFSVTEERTEKSNTMAVRELAEKAVENGLDIDVVIRFFPIITRSGLFLPKKRKVGNFIVYDVPKVGVRFLYSAVLTRLILFILGFRGNSDYAICHMTSNLEAAKRVLGERVSDYFFICHQSDIKCKWLGWSVSNSTATFARSYAIENLLRERNLNCSGVLFSGIPEKYIVKGSAVESEISPTKFMVACNLIPLKNVIPSLKAFALLKDEEKNITMKIYGDGPLKPEISKLIKSENLEGSVELFGFQPKSEVLDAMRKADIFLMPSAPETFGLAFLEAMASGCVVIGHKGWGVDGVVADGVNGFLVDSNSVDDILCKMRASINSLVFNKTRKESLKSINMFTDEKAGINYKRHISSFIS